MENNLENENENNLEKSLNKDERKENINSIDLGKRDILNDETKADVVKDTNGDSTNVNNDVKKPSMMREVIDWALHIGAAVVIALLIVKYVAQITVVIGSSMAPTLQQGNRLVMEKISRNFGDFSRGDIVVIEAKKELEAMGQPASHSPLIKRIIGIEGDRVQVKDGKVYVNENMLEENYINGKYTENGRYSDVVVPVGSVFIMGDNRKRDMSIDSRVLGVFGKDRIVGRVFVRLFPLNEIGGLNK